MEVWKKHREFTRIDILTEYFLLLKHLERYMQNYVKQGVNKNACVRRPETVPIPLLEGAILNAVDQNSSNSTKKIALP